MIRRAAWLLHAFVAAPLFRAAGAVFWQTAALAGVVPTLRAAHVRGTDAALIDVLRAVLRERQAQDQKWGAGSFPSAGFGVGLVELADDVEALKAKCDAADAGGRNTLGRVLLEEVGEVLVATDLDNLRDELVQVAAVAVKGLERLRILHPPRQAWPELDPGPELDPLVTVCDACGRACCWYGEFMCDSAQSANVRTVRRSVLEATFQRLEHPCYWSDQALRDGGIRRPAPAAS